MSIGQYVPTAQSLAWIKRNQDQLGIYQNSSKKPCNAYEKALLLTENVQEILYRGVPAVESTQAREALLHYIAEKKATMLPPLMGSKFYKKPIKMDTLFNSIRGRKLYQAAIEEEAKTRAFRESVLLSCTAAYHSQEKLKKPVDIAIIGPGASGKSTCAQDIIQEKVGPDEGEAGNAINLFVSIDGGIEREQSQIRNLLAGFAEHMGYSGIEDLDKLSSGLKIKKILVEAIKDHPEGISTVNPVTCSFPTGDKDIPPLSDEREMIVREVVAGDHYYEEGASEKEATRAFGADIVKAGMARAWYIGKENPEDFGVDIKPNNEQKKYHGYLFSFLNGTMGSRKFVKKIQKLIEQGQIDYAQVKYDLMFVKFNQQTNNLEVCEASDPDRKYITRRGFNDWNIFHQENPEMNVEDWFKNIYLKSQSAKSNIVKEDLQKGESLSEWEDLGEAQGLEQSGEKEWDSDWVIEAEVAAAEESAEISEEDDSDLDDWGEDLAEEMTGVRPTLQPPDEQRAQAQRDSERVKKLQVLRSLSKAQPRTPETPQKAESPKPKLKPS